MSTESFPITCRVVLMAVLKLKELLYSSNSLLDLVKVDWGIIGAGPTSLPEEAKMELADRLWIGAQTRSVVFQLGDGGWIVVSLMRDNRTMGYDWYGIVDQRNKERQTLARLNWHMGESEFSITADECRALKDYLDRLSGASKEVEVVDSI